MRESCLLFIVIWRQKSQIVNFTKNAFQLTDRYICTKKMQYVLLSAAKVPYLSVYRTGTVESTQNAKKWGIQPNRGEASFIMKHSPYGFDRK